MATRAAPKRKTARPARKATQQPSVKGLRDQIIGRICRLADAMVRMSSGYIQQRWKLRNTDLHLLNVLDQEVPLSVNEISRRALVDQAWVSRSLRLLEARRLVARRSDPQDSRLALVTLTARGRATLDEFRPYAMWSEELLLRDIDAVTLKQLLDRLEANTESLMRTLRAEPGPKPDRPSSRRR